MKKMYGTMDGNEAAAYASYAFTEVAAIYPITPSSPMAEYVDRWAAKGKKNIFGETVKLVEMQSEAGAISAVHGAAEAGVLTSTYTASQGLLLMVPVMHRIAGQMKSSVIHVAARSVASHAYSIFAEHSDVMACRHTGYAILASSSVQEAMDIGAVAHLSSIEGHIPFLHFFDGFRTSHEIQKIELLDYDELKKLVNQKELDAFRDDNLNPNHPIIRNSGQAPEIYFQSREASSHFYVELPDIVESYMEKMSAITGREYKLFNYFGAPDADNVIVAMGSSCGTIRETVNYLNNNGEKTGLIEVHLYRPFSAKHFLSVLPDTVKTLTVLDRTKESGSYGDPLFEDVCAVIKDSGKDIRVLAGRYGLGGKDTPPAYIKGIFDNAKDISPRNHFTVGIVDDILGTSLPIPPALDLSPEGQVSCKFWGLGSDGTVGANKNSIKIIGDYTDYYVQAYFEYDGKKSGGITKSHLRFGKGPIQSSYYVKHADFVACHNPAYMHKYDMHSDVKPGGSFLLNCSWKMEELEEKLPVSFKNYVANNNIKFYTIDATHIAKDIGMRGRTNTILQAAFFKIAGILPIEDAVKYLKEFAEKTYGAKGNDVVKMNMEAIDSGVTGVVEVEIPDSWKTTKEGFVKKGMDPSLPEYIHKIMVPVLEQKGGDIPVSDFRDYMDGHVPVGTSKYEKRGIAVELPRWDSEKCIQCNQCAYVCPHATIRPFLLTKEEKEAAPKGLVTSPAKGKEGEGYEYRLQVDPLDCVGCGSCANVCPAKEKALKMVPAEEETREIENWDYVYALPERNPYDDKNVKGSQFNKPLLEFPGACGGCGETPYVKLITQLFGDRMNITTATGCALVWATDYPVGPYTINDKGRGPAMSNSLFENNGEFGYGIALGSVAFRERLKKTAASLKEEVSDAKLNEAISAWIEDFNNNATTVMRSDALVEELSRFKDNEKASFLLKSKDQLAKRSVWLLGGDGWAYDIGYGGLDHVLASGEDVNILVLDTEVYSNTGGQSSKATPKGAVAEFAASGRKSRKKDLGLMAMAYENVYVAQVCIGADKQQYINAVLEAESYPGPSIIIAYAPCINHGLKCGMDKVMDEENRAVLSGYWNLYRYDPRRTEKGLNPFVLDSKEPTIPLREFMDGEVRFASLKRSFPEEAERLAAEAEADAMAKYKKYKKLAE